MTAVIYDVTPESLGWLKISGRVYETPDGRRYEFPPGQPKLVGVYREVADNEIIHLPPAVGYRG